MRKVVDNSNAEFLLPDINWFRAKSTPKSPEHQFFTLATEFWCDGSGNCYGRINAADAKRLLARWQTLHPSLAGTFRKIARYTIARLKQY